MTENQTTSQADAPRGDVDDLIFSAESGWHTSDR